MQNKTIFNKLVKLFARLRSKKGCPWDKAQTINSLKKSFLSETREVLKAINNKDIENIEEELGDVIWVVLSICQIAKEKKYFDIYDVLESTKRKVIRRHPHVFGNLQAKTPKEALKIFNAMKKKYSKKR